MLQVFGVAAVPSEQHEVGSKNIKEGHLRILSFDMVQQRSGSLRGSHPIIPKCVQMHFGEALNLSHASVIL